MRPAHYFCVLACIALLLAGCGSDDEIDASKTEEEIAAGVEKATATEEVKIDCPDDVERKAGDVFECDLTAAGGVKAKVKVTQMDDDGKIRWEVNP